MGAAKTVFKNAIFNSTTQLVGSLSGFFITIFLARFLQPEYFGIYSLAISISMLSVALTNLGIDEAITRFVAYYYKKRDFKALRGAIRYLLKIKITLAMIVGITLIVISPFLSEFFKSEKLTLPLALAGFVVMFNSSTNSLKAISAGLQKFEFILGRQIVYELFRWIFVIPLAMFFMASGAVAGNVLATAVSLIFIFYVLIRRFSFCLIGPKFLRKEDKLLSFVAFTTIAGIAGIVYLYIDVIMIGWLLGPKHVGYYRVGLTIVTAITALTALGNVVLPVFTEMEKKELKKAVNIVTKYSCFITFPLAVVLFNFSEEIIKVAFGPSYLPGAEPLKVLSLFLITSAFGPAVMVFTAKAKPHYFAHVRVFSTLLNVVLNYFLIISMGIIGAAIATVISRAFSAAVSLLILSKKLEVQIQPVMIGKLLIISIFMFSVLKILPPPTSILCGIAEIIAGLSTFFISGILLKVISRDDIDFLKSIFKN